MLTNRKPAHRRGKVQLIDATRWHTPLRKNLGKKNVELTEAHLDRVVAAFLAFENAGDVPGVGDRSKVFPNAHFGYEKVVVERPLRLRSALTKKAVESLRFASGDAATRRALYEEFGPALHEDFGRVRRDVEAWLEAPDPAHDGDGDGDGDPPPRVPASGRKKLLKASTWADDHALHAAARSVRQTVGEEEYPDHNAFRALVDAALDDAGIKLSAAKRKKVYAAAGTPDEAAPPVVKKVHKKGAAPDPLHGLFEAEIDGRARVVEYEPDPDLRDAERVPLTEPGGAAAFFEREVTPFAPDAWVDRSKTKVGYEISFNREFYEPPTPRPLSAIRADIEALETETAGLLGGVLVDADAGGTP